jgi:ubiquitin thioesterase OTU1
MLLAEFQALVQQQTGIPIYAQIFAVGFPPQKLDLSGGEGRVGGLFKNGDVVLVTAMEEEGEESTMKQGSGWEYPPTITKQGVMERREMPRDNSCLFHSVLLGLGGEGGDASVPALRELIANMVASEPQRYNTVFLGSPNLGYQHHILNPDTWGGAIELSILARHYQAEIVAFDYHNLREDVFGEGDGYKKRVFLIYTGDHYDAMVYRQGAEDIKNFSTQDTYAWERARQQASHLHEDAAKNGACVRVEKWRREIRDKKPSKPQFEAGSGRLDGKGEWVCGSCTLTNDSSEEKCIACGVGTRSSPTASSSSSSSSSSPPSSSLLSAFPSGNPSTTSTSTSTTTNPPAKHAADGDTINEADAAAIAAAMAEESGGTKSAGWQCESCTYHNTGSGGKCDVCGLDRYGNTSLDDLRNLPPPEQAEPESLIGPDSSMLPPSPWMGGFGGFGGMGMGLGGGNQDWGHHNRDWICGACTMVNQTWTSDCPTCRTPNAAYADNPSPSRGGMLQGQGGSMGSRDATEGQGGFGMLSTALQGMVGGGGVQVELWPCPRCQVPNNPNSIMCKSCRSPNPYIQQAQAGECNIS